MADAARKLDLAKTDRTRREITSKQEIAIRELLVGKTDEQAAKAASVSRSTVNQWKHNAPYFMTELAKRRAEIWNDTRNSIRGITQAAIAEVGRAVKAQDTRTAIWVLEKCGGFDEIAKDEFAGLKASPLSIDEVLYRFADKETNQEMAGVKVPPAPPHPMAMEDIFAEPPPTPEQIRYRTLRGEVYNKVLAKLRNEYLPVEDEAEDDAEE